MRHAKGKEKRHTYRGLRVDVPPQPGGRAGMTIVSVDGGVLPPTHQAARIGILGYEWGSEHDGTSLAHAMLAHEFGVGVAERFYQDYARMIVAHLPKTGASGTAWIITSADLRAWLDEQST